MGENGKIAELLSSIYDLEEDLMSSRSIKQDIRSGFEDLRKNLRELEGHIPNGPNTVLEGLEMLVGSTSDVELRSTLERSFQAIRLLGSSELHNGLDPIMVEARIRSIA